MPNGFKKYIDTGGKSLSDIKKQIGKMISKTANSVVDEFENEVCRQIGKTIKNTVKDAFQTAGEKIPPKEESRENINERKIFLEADEIAYPRESLSEDLSPHDILINEKIFNMRKQKETSHNGYIVQRCSEITFVLQGEYVAGVEDDYSRSAFFGMTTPMYAAMSNSQLRTYFTWRTDIRRGVFRETDRAYVILYVYELLNKIGVSSSDEAFEKLLWIWENAAKKSRYPAEPLSRWIKDFYAFNNVSAEFPENFLGNNGESSEKKAAVEISCGNYENKLEFLACNSAYKIKESSFYSEKTAPIIDAALGAVLKKLSEYCEGKGVCLDELVCGQLKKDHAWRAFSGALVNLDRMDGFRSVRISPEENYCVKRGEPVREEFLLSPQRGIIGFILKSTEAELRRCTGFSRKITADAKMLLNDVKNREKAAAAVLSGEFSEAIKNAVDEFCAQNNIFARDKSKKRFEKDAEDNFSYAAKKVEIDVSKLEKIRESSEEIAKKLIVEESLPTYESGGTDIPAAEILFPKARDIEDMAKKISDEDFSESISGYSVMSEDKGGWDGFANRLSEKNRGLLAAMCENKSAADYCRENGIMPEAAFEEINELALEFIGDILVENGEIISDYRGQAEKYFRISGQR